MRRIRVSPRAFAWFALAGLVLNVAIVLTGAAVRVTGSGLGCPTWPTCDGANLIGAWRYHAAIEWGNRLFSTLVTLASVACFVASFRRTPARRDLQWLSFGLVAGVLAQIVLGGLTVLLHLSPVAVMSHFALSMLILVDALALWHRSGAASPSSASAEGSGSRAPGAEPSRSVPPAGTQLARLTMATAAVVLVLGTAATAAGPHSGAEDVRRLGNLELAVKIHGTAVLVLLALALATRLTLHRHGAAPPVLAASTAQLWIMASQAVLGWAQYQLEAPALLVELHVAGAVAVWLASVWLVLQTSPAGASGPVHPHQPSAVGTRA